MPDYDGLEITVDTVEVTEEEVEQTLSNLRERFSTLTNAERPAEEGDFASIDLAAKVDGEDVEDARTSGYSYEVGSRSSVEGLDDQLVGMNAGDSKTFTTTLVGGEHEGQEAEVTVTVHSVKIKELPELDDEFAQLGSEFDTIEELRERRPQAARPAEARPAARPGARQGARGAHGEARHPAARQRDRERGPAP